MENNSPSRSFFSNSASDHPLITSGHVITSSNLSIPWIGSIGSARRPGSAVTSPGSAGSPPGDQAEMTRRKLKRILHLRSPLSSVESRNSHRVVGSTTKVVPPMKVGTKEDDVLVMDAVPIQFSRGMEEQRGSRLMKPHKSEEDKRAQGSRVSHISPPATSTASPWSKEKILKKEEAVPGRRDFVWPPTMEEECIITKVLYRPSDRKRLPVFVQICPT
ncbi:uncharacterized protein LOC144565318 [Carex rostrata]